MKSFVDEDDREKGKPFESLRSFLRRREVLATLLIVIIAVSAVYSQTTARYPLQVAARNIVGIIKVEGYVETPEAVSWYSNIINQAMLNDSIKAVVLVVDSGGGYAHYIEQIYLDLLELREKKPLVASVFSALSGGYYIAVAAEHIYVHPTSFVGNVGVKGSMPSIYILPEEYIETGAYKWPGFSRLLFPFNLSRASDSFASAVNASRWGKLKLSLIELKRAMIYLGSEAVDAGLADEIGSIQTAIAKAAGMAEPELKQYEVAELRPQLVSSLSSWQGSSNYSSVALWNVTLEELDELHPPPALHYIYLPPETLIRSASSPGPSFAAAGLPAGEGKVLIDLTHGNQISWWDLDILIAELAMRNATVGFVPAWHDLDSKLANASCLVVASPTQVYSDDECERIGEFVDAGGLLLVFFDPAGERIGLEGVLEGIVAPVNSLSTRFGFAFAKGYLYNELDHFGIYRNIYVRSFAGGSLTQGLDSLVFFTAAHIYSTGKGLAWTANDTYSSIAERQGSYAAIVQVQRGNGTVAAFGDLTFLSEPYCYVDDNYQLILNLASLISEVEVRAEEGDEEDLEEVQVAKPDLPVETEKNFTEWIDGAESLVRWLKVSETEVTVERPDGTTRFYFTEDGALERWAAGEMECVYDVPLPEPPFPLTKGKKWDYESGYTFTVEGVAHEGKVAGSEEVDGFEDVVAGDGTSYFCARVEYSEEEQLTIDGSNMTMTSTGTYWVSQDAGTVRQESTTAYYLDGALSSTERRTLLLTSIRKGQA